MMSIDRFCFVADFVFALLLAAVGSDVLHADEHVELKAVGQLPACIHEPSGLCKSRQHDGVFWTHSDSGNPPMLYAINRTGSLLATYRIDGAINFDWESVETDDDGHLYFYLMLATTCLAYRSKLGGSMLLVNPIRSPLRRTYTWNRKRNQCRSA